MAIDPEMDNLADDGRFQIFCWGILSVSDRRELVVNFVVAGGRVTFTSLREAGLLLSFAGVSFADCCCNHLDMCHISRAHSAIAANFLRFPSGPYLSSSRTSFHT